MICPQCNSVYSDDYVYCLNDGNPLVDESGEQQTVVNRIVMPPQTDPGEVMVACTSCGVANRSNSRFCKKCGGPTVSSPGVAFDFNPFPVSPPRLTASGTPPTHNTVVFQPPNASPPGGISRPADNQNQLMLIGFLVVAVLIGGAIIYSMSGDTKPAANYTNTNSSAPKHPDVGKTGKLNTNANIRSSSNKTALSLGVHYYDARIKVLEAVGYNTSDGYALWYRVQVLQNGCDREEGLGCGNDRDRNPGQAAMEGWMSARNISLD